MSATGTSSPSQLTFQAPGDPDGPRRLDVLVVDDSEAVRTSFVMILRNAGYEVGEAENGAVALLVLSSTEVGTIVLDVQMPLLGGLQFLDAVTDPPPVLLMTSHVYDAEVAARRSKVFAYAQKPIPPGDLLDLVASALGGAGRTGDLETS